MALVENTLFGVESLIQKTIQRLRYYEPPEGFYFANSGGKDSVVTRDLLMRAGVKYDAHYMATTIDPPEVVRFMREHHLETEFHYPPGSYFKEIVRRGFPMRQNRWCCEFLKEYGGDNRLVVTGIRAAESARRKKRIMFEHCIKREKQYLHTIFEWKNEEIWEYIRKNNLPYCELYDRGWKRIGCLGCPMSYYKRRIEELNQYPRVERAYRRAFGELYAKRKDRDNYQRWSSGNELFEWWLSGDGQKIDENDRMLFV